MNPITLILYSRKGCCLCEGLDNRLKFIDWAQFNPPLRYTVIDIDHSSIPKSEKKLYSLEVPVMLLKIAENNKIYRLPRVSPRMDSQALAKWLQSSLVQILQSL
tara:strand:- start:94 stop:405 length:312 start_codon:yes stop_codon:yes gene_type:complete